MPSFCLPWLQFSWLKNCSHFCSQTLTFLWLWKRSFCRQYTFKTPKMIVKQKKENAVNNWFTAFSLGLWSFFATSEVLQKRNSSGAGGNWTLVQTRKPYAFYTLIPDCGFRDTPRPGPPSASLSSKNFTYGTRLPTAIPDFAAPRIWTLQENGFQCDVSFQCLTKE